MSKHTKPKEPKNVLIYPTIDDTKLYPVGIEERRNYLKWIEQNGLDWIRQTQNTMPPEHKGDIRGLKDDINETDNSQDHDGYAYKWLKETFWNIGTSKSFLDIGCNVGLTCMALHKAKYFNRVCGVDLSMLLTGYARALSREFEMLELEFKCSDALSLPYKDKEFDICYSSHTLEHVISPYLVLKEQARVGKIVTGFVPYEHRCSCKEHIYKFNEESLGEVMDSLFKTWEVKTFEKSVIAYGGIV